MKRHTTRGRCRRQGLSRSPRAHRGTLSRGAVGRGLEVLESRLCLDGVAPELLSVFPLCDPLQQNAAREESPPIHILAHDVSGVIDTDTVWDDTTQPYNLVGDVFVRSGATLRIDPGVTVTTAHTSYELFVGDDAIGGTLDADQADLAAEIYVSDNGTALIDQCEVTFLHSTGATTVTDSTIERLGVVGDTPPVLTGNTFPTASPAVVLGEYVPELAANTFSALNATVEVYGSSIDVDTLWPDIPNVIAYQTAGDVYVRGGATLTIAPGVAVTQGHSSYELHVGDDAIGGTLDADQADLAAEIYVYQNGTALVEQCEVTFLHSTGATTVTGSTVERLEVIGDVPPVLTGNTFSTDWPVMLLGEYVPELAANTFSALNATVEVYGSIIDVDTLWPDIPNVLTYRLSGDVHVQGDATLTIAPDVTITQGHGDWELHVGYDAIGGFLNASCAVFTNEVYLYDNAGGTVRFCQFPGAAVTIYDGATVWMHENNLAGVSITAVGDPAQEIDLTNNWWGTTNPAQIENMILHRVDNANRPLVLFEPFLVNPPEVPDLAVQTFTVDTPVLYAGNTITVSYAAENLSLAGDAGWTATLFYLNADDSLDNAVYLAMVPTAPLAAGESTGVQTIELLLPGANDPIWAGGLPGTYTLTMFVDALDQVPECCNLNNKRSLGVSVLAPTIEARQAFYNDSKWDESPGNPEGDPAANAYDDNAIAPDKTALLPGESATFAHYTSFSKGINGIMVDIAGLPGTPIADDFELRMGNDGSPDGWPAAPDPSITVRAGEGVGGSDRVTLIWASFDTVNPDPTAQAVAKAWLQVTVLATPNTGLEAIGTDGPTGLPIGDVFYFGNALGDSGTGNFGGVAQVNAVDSGAVRDNPHNPFVDPAPIDDFVDFNRDQWVNAVDFGLVRDNATNPLTALKLITAPAAGSPTGPEGAAARIEQGALHDAALSGLHVEAAGLSGAASRGADAPELSWLEALDSCCVRQRSSESTDPATSAVEKLLATL